MTLFLQACAGVLLAVILSLTMGSGKGMATLLTLAVCSMVGLIAMEYLQPVIEFLNTLQNVGGLDSELLKLLLKAAGIGMTTELACLVCNDSGNASMGKAVQILGAAVILWLSLPLLTAFMELLRGILGEL